MCFGEEVGSNRALSFGPLNGCPSYRKLFLGLIIGRGGSVDAGVFRAGQGEVLEKLRQDRSWNVDHKKVYGITNSESEVRSNSA